MTQAASITRPARGRPDRRAFTFIEILATLTLLAIVLPPVMQGISLCLATAEFAKQQAQASSLCHGKLMELTAGSQWQQTQLAGDFSPDRPEFKWTAQVSEWDGTLVQQLDVTVTWQSRGKNRQVTASTLVYSGAGATTGTGVTK